MIIGKHSFNVIAYRRTQHAGSHRHPPQNGFGHAALAKPGIINGCKNRTNPP
jgi:hypothetical protein